MNKDKEEFYDKWCVPPNAMNAPEFYSYQNGIVDLDADKVWQWIEEKKKEWTKEAVKIHGAGEDKTVIADTEVSDLLIPGFVQNESNKIIQKLHTKHEKELLEIIINKVIQRLEEDKIIAKRERKNNLTEYDPKKDNNFI